MRRSGIAAVLALLVGGCSGGTDGEESPESVEVVRDWERGDRVVLLPSVYIDDELGYERIVTESPWGGVVWYIAEGTEGTVVGPAEGGEKFEVTIPGSAITPVGSDPPAPQPSQVVRVDRRFLSRPR